MNLSIKFNFGKLGKASLTLAFFTLTSKFVGLLRDRILASSFGASSDLDIYYSAFKIPDFIFNLIILGALSAAFIPVFVDYYSKDKNSAFRTAQNFINVGLLAVALLSVAVFIFANQFAKIVGPGFSPGELSLLTNLIRITLLSPIIFAVSSVLGSILQSLQKFLAYSIAPILYNSGIIVGALWFAPFLKEYQINPVYGLAFGVVLGALLHLLIQLIAVTSYGFRLSMTLDLKDDGLRRIVRLMVPRSLALGTYSVGLIAINAIASHLERGSITVLNLATDLQAVPLSVIAISVATAVFPQLSSHVSKNEMGEFKRKFNKAFISTFLMVSTAAVLIFVLRQPIVNVLFKTGAFTSSNASLTASVLGIFMFSIVGQGLMHITTRAFYALQNTRTPFVVASGSVLLNIGLSLYLTFVLGWDVRGLAVAFSIAHVVHFVILYFLLRRRYF